MGSPFGLWSPTPPTRRLLFHRGATPPPVSGPPPADQSLSLAALSNTRLAAGPAVVRLASLVPRQARDGVPSGVEGRSLTTIPSEGEGPRERPPVLRGVPPSNRVAGDRAAHAAAGPRPARQAVGPSPTASGVGWSVPRHPRIAFRRSRRGRPLREHRWLRPLTGRSPGPSPIGTVR